MKRCGIYLLLLLILGEFTGAGQIARANSLGGVCSEQFLARVSAISSINDKFYGTPLEKVYLSLTIDKNIRGEKRGVQTFKLPKNFISNIHPGSTLEISSQGESLCSLAAIN